MKCSKEKSDSGERKRATGLTHLPSFQSVVRLLIFQEGRRDWSQWIMTALVDTRVPEDGGKVGKSNLCATPSSGRKQLSFISYFIMVIEPKLPVPFHWMVFMENEYFHS